MKTNGIGKDRKIKRLSNKLISIFLPVVAVGIALLVLLVGIFDTKLIHELLYTSFEESVKSDAVEINSELKSTFYYLNAIADSIEVQQFEDDTEIRAFLQQTKGRYDMIPTGAYLSLSDGAFIELTGWDPGMDIREKPWYQEGIAYTDSYYYFYDVPYFDLNTGNLCATVLRHVHLKDGREGVIAADLMMSACQDYLNSVTLYGTGRAMMATSQGLILSAEDTAMCGQNLVDVDNKLFNNMTSVLGNEDGQVAKVNGADGQYFVSTYTVEGTDWKVINYAKATDVLADVLYMLLIVIGAVVAMMIILAALFNVTLNKMIRKPVAALTENIEHISQGDFTVTIDDRGNDEIAYMNKSMNKFIESMRGIISNIQGISTQLETDSKNSQSTAGVLNTEANEQSRSMETILANMESMAESVTEVAENATSLSMTVSELTESENQIETSMVELVDKANVGAEDMTNVRKGMEDVVASMNGMNEAVQSVDAAAVEINQIIDMISGIASQTNLLSLNASIEAARAGEYGRGFAVVASEIGQLANDSAEATRKIGEIIDEMTMKVRDLAERSESNTKMIHDSSEAIDNAATTFQTITAALSDASDTLSKMAERMGTVNDVAANMAAVSEEQSATSQEITATVNQLTESSRNVAESSNTVSNAASSVAVAADSINESVQFFTI
ncbi:methyl-accepting chemotaxis protein [Pseudobutyrivibrio sp. C4]|uniref:methyl-accepting chemotaxis protein n=1 Tax=Pseudobutyrivibrio sp. C4 TaxID=1520803 RepID=UPI0008D0E2EB|nr:methyl-accepting chemotaxis protein [Pseudobutyrivibrio sp. C4]SET24117.1 methyl-accepting chemotaxis protein [Pseudobutyrivibrio sp. C4]